MRGQVCCGLWSIRVNASGLRGCIASSRQAARAGRESTPHQPAHVHCTRPTHNAHQSQAKPAPNPRTRVAPSQQAARTNRKPNPRMRVASNRQAAHTRRKSTLHQFAYVRCTEPIRGAHQTQVNPASNPRTRVALSRHAARTKRKSTPRQPAHARCTEPTGGAPNVSRLRLNLHMCIASSRHATHTKRKSTSHQSAHAHFIEPTRGAHQTQVTPAPNPRTRQTRRQSNRHIAKKVTVFAPFMYFMPHLPQSWLTFMQYASSELTA